MKLRSKKVLSLLLAASMVLGMNTIAFADDVAEVAATEETAEVAASTNGTLDHFSNTSGLGYNKDGDVVTEISYATNGAKKNAEDNVATITKVSDPVSWNNFRGRNLIATVLYGNNKNDEYLNNKAKLSVSSTDMDDYVPGRVFDNSSFFDVVKVQDGVYLFVGYSLKDGGRDYVAGQDDVVSDPLNYYVQVNEIPVREWDGRKIAFNKSGKNNATASNVEALNVNVALVKYEGNTVTELNGASVANVKIDKKATKKASVAYATTKVEKAGKVIGYYDGKETDGKTTIDEHATLGDLPSFTIKVKLDKNVKTYGKDLKTALKDKKYFFGIKQCGIEVTDPTASDDDDDDSGVYRNEYFGDNAGKHWSYKGGKLVVNPASANDAESIQKSIAEKYATAGYVSGVDHTEITVGDLKVSKFTEKKVNVVLPVNTSKKGTVKENGATITLKTKKDYELKEGSLAGEKVFYLDFPEGGNYVYANTSPDEYEDEDEYDLSVFGYKWAFRKSPDKKSKKFRYGIYAANDLGFVFSK